ncbi:sugar-binding domain-containing protein [Luteococcus sp. H138]|uniref:sugar-binding transcriptional regulator n=1 Tax=unclassified Luteococcus TaxID=2639923 RepID=UPI00313CB1A9
MSRRDDKYDHLLLRAAELYHERDLTQQEVALRLHLTRWQVGRLLAEAKRRGVVQIRIVHPRARCHDLEEAMVERFALQASIVVPGAAQHEDNLRLVAGAAADALADLSPGPRIVAASWGYTMTALAEQVPSMWTERATVVQANGGLSHPGWGDPASVITRLARQSNGTPVFLPAPAIIDSLALAPALRREPAIRGVLELARTAEAIVFSLGAATRESVLVQSGCLTAQQIDRLRERGAVGDVLARFLNCHGEPVDEDLQSRTIGLDLADIRAIPISIGVCAGPEKVAIARATLNQKICTVLVTDQRTATTLLDDAVPAQ